MEEITKGEERIMQVLWELKSAFVKDILAHLPDDPKPPYNTVSSFVRQLEKKGYIGYKAYGKTHEYFPLITKSAYRKHAFFKLFTNYFDDSAEALMSFMVKEKGLTPDEIEEIKKRLDHK